MTLHSRHKHGRPRPCSDKASQPIAILIKICGLAFNRINFPQLWLYSCIAKILQQHLSLVCLMGYGAFCHRTNLASLVLKSKVAEQAARDSDGTRLNPVRPSVLDSGTEIHSCCCREFRKLEERKESSTHESRFFSHCTGSKHGGDGRLRQ